MLNPAQDTVMYMNPKTAVLPPLVKPGTPAMPRLFRCWFRYFIGTLILLSGSTVLLMNAFNSF